MQRTPIKGECVVVARNTVGHSFTVGDRLIVNQVDSSDDTLRGTPQGSTTMAPSWLPWKDAEPVSFGWGYARKHLPGETAALLSACDGVEHLSLNQAVKAAIVDGLTDWRQRVLAALADIESEAPATTN